MTNSLDQRIRSLAAQLPLQRRQLAMQSARLAQAVRYRLSAPTTLAVAAAGGALLGWCCFGPDTGSTLNSGGADSATVGNAAPGITAFLQQSLSAVAMACLAHSLA